MIRTTEKSVIFGQLPAEPGHPGVTHSLTVDSHDLDSAPKRDRETGKAQDEKGLVQVSMPQVVESCGERADRNAIERSRARARNRAISGGTAN